MSPTDRSVLGSRHTPGSASHQLLTTRLLLTARETAEALGICQRTLWQLTADGELTPLRLPCRGKARTLRYSVAELERWIAQTMVAQTTAGNGHARQEETTTGLT
jgi:predicted DNA-binding transcriptional regulator AlpA